MPNIPGIKDAVSPYGNDIQYLRDELNRLDIIIEIALQRARSRADDPLRGMYVSDEQAAALLRESEGQIAIEEEQAARDCRERAQAALSIIERRLEESQKAGFTPALQRTARNLRLSREELDIVVFSASAELESRYAKIFGYLHDDLTRWRPSPGLITESLFLPEERMEKRRLFLPGSALLKNGILVAADGREVSLFSGLALNPDVLEFITEKGEAESGGAAEQGCCRDLRQVLLPEESCSKAIRLAEQFLAAEATKDEKEPEGMGQGWICILQGERGSGRRALADLICDKLGRKAVEIDWQAKDGEEASLKIKRGFTQAAIRSAPVLIEGYEDAVQVAAAQATEEAGAGTVLLKELEGFRGLAIITGRKPVHLPGALQANKQISAIEIPPADYAARRRIWQHLLGEKSEYSPAYELAAQFRLTPGRIMDAYASAVSQAALEGRATADLDDIYQACRRESSRNLSSLARRIEPRRRLDEIVLPPDKTEQLLEIKSQIKNRGLVYLDWGFERKLSLGRGMNVLFSGSSGTGKTMAAEALAGELGLDLYKIDLSMVVSKYIGETEKNLKRIFDEAEESNAVLFFDEADAIFGKRSDVRDSHDRYANVEISYLLQKMEEHEGIVILASNLSRNMDDAFLRRMHFVVEFPFPEEDCRLQIWKMLLPAEAPREDDLDYEFLAGKLNLAGGNIKNILVAAAFLAAEDGGVIGMKHLVNAAWKEMRKIGRVCSPADFGGYYKLIEAN